jgi:hypothetical protein
MFDVFTAGDTAHIDTLFTFLPCHTRVNMGASIFFTAAMPRVCGKNLNNVPMCAVSPVVHTSNISSCQKTFSVFLRL